MLFVVLVLFTLSIYLSIRINSCEHWHIRSADPLGNERQPLGRRHSRLHRPVEGTHAINATSIYSNALHLMRITNSFMYVFVCMCIRRI